MTNRARRIFCASCRGSIARASARCPSCGGEPRLAGRYELLGELGRGASGVTWRARRPSDGRKVAIKERLVAGARSFEELDRIKREATFLESLDHPGVARLVEHFVTDDGPRTGFYLVTELVRGQTLAHEMTGPRSDVRKVLGDLAALLDVLAYLHGRSPAVVHGDVKPENVVRRASDGALVLVDFHAARDFPSSTPVGMTTAIGTPGFMAPEQLTGHAEPRTDIHAAACVAIALLTRRPLHTLVDDDFRLNWRGAIHVARPIEQLLGRMLEPALSRRARDAALLAREARALARMRPARSFGWASAAVVAGAGAALGGAILFKATTAPGSREALAAHPAELAASLGHVPKIDLRSRCEAKGTCLPLRRGAIADQVRAACAEVKKAKTGAPTRSFTIDVAGNVGSCFAAYPTEECSAMCTFSGVGRDAPGSFARATAIKSALDDLYGRPRAATTRVLLDGALTPHWDWRDPGETHTKGVWTMSGEVRSSASSAHEARFELTILAPC